MLTYIFIVEGAGYAGAAEYMQAHDGRPLPLVILTELGESSGCHEFGQGGCMRDRHKAPSVRAGSRL
jgi:hypothetical protein